MISVVICSANKNLAGQVKQNIAETIGVPWQLVLIDNSELQKGICHVYNLGAAQAEYDIICFVHEDVLFRTKAWGALIAGYFNSDAHLGLVGIAGGKYKSQTLSSWWTGIPALDCCNVFYPDAAGNIHRVLANPGPAQQLQQVVTIDGVFMCASKKAWQQTRFDEVNIPGFHFYDISFSFAVATRFNVAVSFEIDILHLKRYGDHDDSWLEVALNWHEKNKALLPLSVVSTQVNESRIYRNWLSRLRFDKINMRNRLRLVFSAKHWMNVLVWPYVAVFLTAGPAGNRKRKQRGK